MNRNAEHCDDCGESVSGNGACGNRECCGAERFWCSYCQDDVAPCECARPESHEKANVRMGVNVTETPGANIFRCGHESCEANATIHYSGSVQAHRCAEHPIDGFARPAKQGSESAQ